LSCNKLLAIYGCSIAKSGINKMKNYENIK